MTISTIKKPLIIFFTVLLAIIFSFTVYFNVSATSVSVGTTLFTSIDNVTISGTTSGLNLTSTGKRDTSAQYVRKLYLGNNFSLNYKIVTNDFESLVFTFIYDYDEYSNFTGNIPDEQRKIIIKLTKTESGFDATLNGENLKSISSDFSGDMRLGYNKTDKKFYIDVNGITSFDNVTDIYNNEAYLTVGFEGIEVTKTAEILITNINNQPFTSVTAGYTEDDIAPILRLNSNLVQFDGENIKVEAPIFKLYQVPVYGLDIISSTIKYEIKTLYSEDEIFDSEDEDDEDNIETFNSNEISLQKVGYYKITEVKINDNNGNETTECVDFDFANKDYIIHSSVWDSDAPVIINFDNYINSFDEIYYNGGSTNKFKFKAPEVQINCTPIAVTENVNLISYKLHYRLSNASTWSVQDGLVFSAKSVGSYDFRLQAVDRMGTFSEKSSIITLFFDDITAPMITITGFSTEKYLDQSVTLPSGSVTDDMDSSPDKTIKVYYIEEDSTETLVSENYTFIPEKLGWYKVVYDATDDSGNSVTLAPMTFEVVEVEEIIAETPPLIDLTNTWNIVFLSIAGLSALGLIILLFIKPKEDK